MELALADTDLSYSWPDPSASPSSPPSSTPLGAAPGASNTSMLGSDVASRAVTNLLWSGAKDFYENIVKAPGQVYSGELQPSMEPGPNQLSVPEYALGLAGYGLGAGSLLPSEAGSVGGMFAGPNARLARVLPEDATIPKGFPAVPSGLAPLADAQFLEDHGMSSPKEVFDQTGWFRGPDNQWRFQLSDEGAQLQTDNMHPQFVTRKDGSQAMLYGIHPYDPLFPETNKLDGILQHDILYESYPWLRNVNVLPETREGMRGGYNVGTNTITLSPDTPDRQMEALLHETQHAIQYSEGFAVGGGVRDFLPPNFEKDVAASDAHVEGFENFMDREGVNPLMVAAHHGFYPYQDLKYYGQYPEEAAKVPDEVLNQYRSLKARQQELWDQRLDGIRDYLNLAGEVEARTTQMAWRKGRWDQLPQDIGTQNPFVGEPETYPPYSQQNVKFAGWNRPRNRTPKTPRLDEPDSLGIPHPETGELVAPTGHTLTPVEYDPFGHDPFDVTRQ